MTLSRRLLYLLYTASAGCVLCASVALYWVNMTLVDSLAERNAARELDKVESAFLDQLSILRVRAQDWSRQPAVPPANMDGIGQLDLLLNLNGDQVSVTRGKLTADNPTLQALAKHFVKGYCLPTWGVVQVDGRPLLFSTAVEDDCHAYLVGVWLDNGWLSYLSERVGHALYVHPVAKGQSRRGLDERSDGHLIGRFPVPDYLGKRSLEVVVELPRDGYTVALYAVLAVAVMMMLFSLLAVLFVNRRIRPLLFGRLQHLHHAVRSIARGGDLDQRVPVEGKDEIAALAEDFNTMVDSIKHAQNQLGEARRQAEVASQAKSQFLANISHEIRTPMTAILGYTELLRDGSLNRLEQARYVNIIQNNGDALLALINDVLDLSRIEAGQLRLEQRIFAVTELLDEIMASHRLRAEEKQLALTLNYQGEIPQALCGDAFRLRQILMNLIGNAVKFTEHGAVDVDVAWVDERSELQIAVRDTGIGMSDTELASIFQPFSQADASHSRRYAGTGLGLSIARQLARSQGGDIVASSRSGAGSCFELCLQLAPVSQLERSDLVRPSESEAIGRRLSGQVLLVEDNEVNRLFVRKVLEQAGMDVTEAVDGREACSLYGDHIDLVVLDMQMPVMDGYQTVRALRDRGFQGPVLALTANVLAEDRQRCLDAGCDAFMGKPIRVQDLLATCARLLAQPMVASADF
ncbi:MAG: ATP-binding protein [Alcanivorax sp.]|nr:ATP-binding protein [Alcanivorax sp.]